MSALVLSLLESPTVLAIIAAVIGALGYGLQQRRAGAAKERERQAEREREARDVADQVENDVGALPPDGARKELGRWSRD